MERSIISSQNEKESQPREKMEIQQQVGEQENILLIGNYFIPENVFTFESNNQEKNVVAEQSGNPIIPTIDSQSVESKDSEMQPDLPPIVRSSYTLIGMG